MKVKGFETPHLYLYFGVSSNSFLSYPKEEDLSPLEEPRSTAIEPLNRAYTSASRGDIIVKLDPRSKA